MEWEDDCLINRDYLKAKEHGMGEEFFNMPEKQKIEVYCNSCKNWDCYAKRKHS
ncbi:MAG: hypothetical protein QXD43_04025 [Candidatus Aenigmatarchaeota archaeon]